MTDGYYLHSFEVFLAILAVFPGSGNLGYVMLEYRLGHRGILASIVETGMWIPFLCVHISLCSALRLTLRPLRSFFFFGGLSIHLSVAFFAHLFSYNITWGATKKEVERSNFFIEVPRILKRFWLAFAISLACFAAMIVFSLEFVAATGWGIPGSYWAVTLPLAVVAGSHLLFPVSPVDLFCFVDALTVTDCA